jgi:hypothetical protein
MSAEPELGEIEAGELTALTPEVEQAVFSEVAQPVERFPPESFLRQMERSYEARLHMIRIASL